MRFEKRISFKKEIQQPEEFIDNALGFEIKIYKDLDINDQRFTDEMPGSLNDTICSMNNFSTITIGVKNYPAKEIYILGNNGCAGGNFWYSIAKDNYLINIIPMPDKGNGYVGYDGKKETKISIPEFEKILSSFELKN